MVEQEQTTVTIMGENRHVSKVALAHSTRAESCAAVYENNHTPFPFDPTHSDLFTIDDALICIDSLLQPRTELGKFAAGCAVAVQQAGVAPFQDLEVHWRLRLPSAKLRRRLTILRGRSFHKLRDSRDAA